MQPQIVEKVTRISYLQTSKIIQWIYSLWILHELVELPAILDIFHQLVNATSTSGVVGSHEVGAERDNIKLKTAKSVN